MRTDRLEAAVRKLAACRTERDQLRLVRKWLSACEREYIEPDTTGEEQGHPCWKWLRDSEEPYSGEFARGSEDPKHWCTPCRLRQPVHLAYKAAVMAYGRASRSFWMTVRAMQARGVL